MLNSLSMLSNLTIFLLSLGLNVLTYCTFTQHNPVDGIVKLTNNSNRTEYKFTQQVNFGKDCFVQLLRMTALV